MKVKEQKERRLSVILTPDTEGTKKVFGIPAARRLALLCAQIGYGEIHVAGGTDHFKELLADLAAPDGFHPVEDREGLEDAAAAILASLSRPEEVKILVMRADLVVDRDRRKPLICSWRDAGRPGGHPPVPCPPRYR